VAHSDYQLDITGEVCPMTFVRTKLLLERMTPGQVASIRLRGGEPLDNVPRAVRDHGHEVLTLDLLGNDLYELVIRRC
jgi:TusA-related sulfurtransferase